MIEWELPLRLAHKASYLMAMQERSGVCFDVEAGQALAQRIREEMQAIRQEVEPQLPTRQLNKTEAKEYCFPAKPWKADGSWSHHMQRFFQILYRLVYSPVRLVVLGCLCIAAL